MKKTTKVISSIGVAAAMTASIFTPAVFAEEKKTGEENSKESLIPLNYEEQKTGAEVKVKLTVVGETPTVDITDPLDEAVIIGLSTDVKVDYTNAAELQYELVHVAEDGTKTSYELPPEDVAEEGTADGTHTFKLDVKKYGGYGTYILKSTAVGVETVTDSVQFTFRSMEIEEETKVDNNNNQIIRLCPDGLTKKAKVQAFDKNGKAILDKPIEIEFKDGKCTDVVIPFSNYGVPEGDYKVVTTTYDDDDNITGTYEKIVHYTPAPVPEVPDTGSSKGLFGLSQSDFVSTGIALLFITTVFGILIFAKKSRKNHRR